MSTKGSRDFRPAFHFTPERGWINDPNGLVAENGRYHLFAQYYPYEPVWGPMHWCHAVSEDLLHWRRLPVALEPDGLGYIFSGSAVYDEGNTSGFGSGDRPPIVIMYTSHGVHEQQCLAYSTDYVNFIKYKGNPVIPNTERQDFRDPKLFPHPGGGWGLVLAAGDRVEFYASEDLKNWRKTGEFGPAGNFAEGVWECPDLFPLDVGGEEKWVLLVSMGAAHGNRGSRTQYFIGSFDGETFTCETPFSQPEWIDQGFDNYAGVTFHNTEDRLLIGWGVNWVYAADLPTGEYCGNMTLPRRLSLTETPLGGLRLASRPAVLPFGEEKPWDGALPGEVFRLTVAGKGPAVIRLENERGQYLEFGVNEQNEITLDRSRAGARDFNAQFGTEWYSKISAPRFFQGDWELELLFDRSVAELFADQYTRAFTALVFPEEPYTRASVRGDAVIRSCCGEKLFPG